MSNKTNSDLFLLLLQHDLKEYLTRIIKIPKKYLSIGLDTIKIDFYMGSMGNIALDEVCIFACNKHTSVILFSINKSGEYNSDLCESDLDLILSFTTIMKFENCLADYYDLFSIPESYDIRYYENILKNAIKDENYELANDMILKINELSN